jgi:thiamine transport system ATP-binding protein
MLALLDQVASDTQATVLMVTHDPDDALQFADLTILVADGVAYPPQRTRELFANPPDSLRNYLGPRK